MQYSIVTQYSHTLSFVTEPEESLDLTWSHLCSPARLAAPPHMQCLARQKAHPCFHSTQDVIPPSSLHLPQGLPEQMARGSALWGGQSFLYSSKLTVFCGKPSLQIKAKTAFWEILSQGLKPPCTLFVWAFLLGGRGRGRSKDAILCCKLVFIHKQTMWQC